MMKRLVSTLLQCSLGVALFFPVSAWAEGYVSGFAGVSIPSQLTNIYDRELNKYLEDFSLQKSLILGGKVGYYLPGKLSWLGAEAEFFQSSPHVKQQDFCTATTQGGACTRTPNVAGSHMRLSTVATNVVVRYPGERFQPYAGAGLGLFYGRVAGPITGTGSDSSFGLNFLTGLRYMVTPDFALFGEYKYTHVHFDFGGTSLQQVDYSGNNFVFGVAYHY